MGAVLTIDLRRLEQAPVEVRGEIAMSDPLWEGVGVELLAPLALEGLAEGSTARGVWLHGSFSSRIATSCRRCLEAMEVEVAEELGLLFDPKTREPEGDLTVYALDPQAVELDLRSTLRERLIMAIPAFPLCRLECRGLCPGCGANLNRESCVCGAAEPDPRWGPLQTLRSDGGPPLGDRDGRTEETHVESP